MLYAILNGKRTKAKSSLRGQIGESEIDGAPVLCKSGDIRTYWAQDFEGAKGVGHHETSWHKKWKSILDDSRCEVVFHEEAHRLDIMGKGKCFDTGEVSDVAIEVQMSEIDIRDIKKELSFIITQPVER